MFQPQSINRIQKSLQEEFSHQIRDQWWNNTISKIDVREGPVLGFTVQGLQISLSWGSPYKEYPPNQGKWSCNISWYVIHQFKTLAAKCLWLFWTSIFWNDCYFFLLFEWDSCTLFYFKFLGFSDRFYFHFPQSCTCSFCCFLSW